VVLNLSRNLGLAFDSRQVHPASTHWSLTAAYTKVMLFVCRQAKYAAKNVVKNRRKRTGRSIARKNWDERCTAGSDAQL